MGKSYLTHNSSEVKVIATHKTAPLFLDNPINPHTVVKKIHPNPVLRVRMAPGDYFKLNVVLHHSKGLCLVVLGLCEDYAKELLSITFHSSKVMISDE